MDVAAAGSWLHWLYGEGFAGRIHICGHANWRGRAFAPHQMGDAVRYAAEMDDGGDALLQVGVYHRLTTLGEISHGRGRDEDSVLLPAVMLDLDLRGPGHKADTYPETLDDLRKVLDLAGLPEPSAWVNSGGGRYPCWKLSTPILLTSSADMFTAAQQEVRTIQRAVREAAASLGWKLDNTSDLARVYRLPGTTNRKGEAPVTVTWELGSGETYLLSELVDHLTPRESAPAPAAPQSSLFADAYAPAAVPQSSLFAEHSHSHSSRTFTVGQAMTFVKPFLDALAAAQDGEINVRLNDAACALAHFGGEFWEEAAADRQLMLALESTAYDGQTWKAEDTIASARRGMASDWRAVLVADAPAIHEAFAESVPPPLDAVAALRAEMVSVRDLAARPSPKSLVRGLLQMDSESWLIGKPGSKKSFVAFDIAARVARGEPWQGRPTYACDVVMIVAEGAGGAGKRGDAWIRTYGELDGIHILPRPVQVADTAAWKVLNEACGQIADEAAQVGRGLLVVIDTQARVTVGLEENSAKEMGLYVEAVRAMRARTGGCILSVHHTGRMGGDARGSSAIDGAQTTELKVESESGSLIGRLVTEKQKDMEPASPVTLGFKSVYLGRDDDGEPVTSLVLVEPDEWRDSVVSADDVTADVDPFGRRVSVDPWIIARVPNAKLQWWIVQALVDTTETLGLTESAVKEMITEKHGRQQPSSWRKAWQKVTDEFGTWADVVRPAGGQRWNVDRLSIPQD